MKHRFTLTLSVVTAIGAGLAGCSPAPAAAVAPTCLGLVVGARSNSAAVDRAMVADVVPKDLGPGSAITVVGVSGSPAGDVRYTAVVPHKDNRIDQQDAVLDVRIAALDAVEAANASVPEADTLGAIEAAARTLSTQSQCVIHVYDSGLSTAGVLRFQENLLAAEPASVIAVASTSASTATLAGITVVFATLGDVAAPQPPLDTLSATNLTEIWRGVVEARGGSVGTPGVVTRHPRAPQAELPLVSVVPVPDRTVDYGDITRMCQDEVVEYDLPSALLFAAKSSELSDGAAEALREPIEIIEENPSVDVRVIGHTSSEGSKTDNLELATRRATAVLNYLEAHLKAPVNIVAEGRGEAEPVCVEAGLSGAELEGCRQRNRRVTLSITGVTACPAESRERH